MNAQNDPKEMQSHNKRTLYIPSKTWSRVDEQSRKTGMSKSRLICLLIEEAAHLVAPSSLRLGR